ncbi:hypothetical protein NHX12_018391 [Muraenolepis orangiensis]|uniref:Meiosis regulator and mRNA stability factor 1 n=1 Tax=Muraenolepis orangiensis TaxID=630683 RepID=A0A9Q0EZI6_9TELE|nr:hypothetical protein NHX12_018391 [Muraenolepis orangiensis]
MESKMPMLELKDAPSPPHYVTTPFPLAPLHLPCLPMPQYPPCSHNHTPCSQLQEGLGPKVSICTWCDHFDTVGYGAFGDTSVDNGKTIGLVSGYMSPSAYKAPISGCVGPAVCSPAPPLSLYPNGHGSTSKASNALCPPAAYQLPSCVAPSQPSSSHSCPPCCTGLLHAFPNLSLSCSLPSSSSPVPLAPPLSSLATLPTPVHGFSGCCLCGANCRAATESQKTIVHRDLLSTSSLYCSPSKHLNVDCTVCLKGSHYCQQCLLKTFYIPRLLAPLNCQGPAVRGGSILQISQTSLGNGRRMFENPPPVGLFWDIENCRVPSGRSAATVVQRLRSRFLEGHREAEFICVCDISKESKTVIQEVNNSQVTIAHICATAKNAADDKLRQSLRRFAETHAAPATIVLVSSDVNFASELSDLRHRHGFQVILVHGTHASPALLQHAHHRVSFQEITDDLPLCLPIKSQPSLHLLYVHNLPVVSAKSLRSALKHRLRRLSDNCGGKVVGVSRGTAVLRFGSPDAAERASKRMENEDVFGYRIRPSFSPHPDGKAPDPEAEQAPQAPPLAPPTVYMPPEAPSFPPASSFLPLEQPRSPRRLRQTSGPLAERPYSPRRGCSKPPGAPSAQPLQELDGVEDESNMTVQLVENTYTCTPNSPLQGDVDSAREQLPKPGLIGESMYRRSPCPNRSVRDCPSVQVSNLDYRISRKELQQTLSNLFSQYGRVKSVELGLHTDYQLKATVQMVSLPQTINAISELHCFKVGRKRLHLCLATGVSSKSLSTLSSEVIGILYDAPASCLPLSKFKELYEKRYSRKLAVGELYRLPQVVAMRDHGGARLVYLLSGIRAHEVWSTGGGSMVFEYHEPICVQHTILQGFSEADFDPDSYIIPFVTMALSDVAPQVHRLLQSHSGTIPLLSFPECYAAQFGPLDLCDETQDGAVPLEHLITCIPSVTIINAQNGFKVVKWVYHHPPALIPEPWTRQSKSPSVELRNPQLIQFSKEIIDMMKGKPACLLPLANFIPSYHHHFAKQCRVADYGYTKILELLEAVPHVLQILGMGTKRLLTLTHRAQLKRFTKDLLKLLKIQDNKEVAMKDFMQAYHWCFCKKWQVTDYGACDLMDLLNVMSNSTITLTQQEDGLAISIPKRERTVEEMEHTKQFSKEMVNLLRHEPHCRMPFSKFISTYHHHFNRQCKLSLYGFSKLQDLFDAIPEVLMVLECGEEKDLILTEPERVKALAAQLVELLRPHRNCSLPVGLLLAEYSRRFGYSLQLQDYDTISLPALLAKLHHVVKVVDGAKGKREVQLINRKSQRLLSCQLLALFMAHVEGPEARGASEKELSGWYLAAYAGGLNPCEYGFLSLSELLQNLPNLVELYQDEEDAGGASGGAPPTGVIDCVRLTPLFQFALRVRSLLVTYHYNQIFLTEFSSAYGKFTGHSLRPHSYGFTAVEDLLSAIPQMVWIRGRGHKRIVVLNNEMKGNGRNFPGNSFPGNRFPGNRFPGNRFPGNRFPGNRFPGDWFPGDWFPGDWFPGDRFPGDHFPSLYLEMRCPLEVCLTVESDLVDLSSPVELLCGPLPSCLPLRHPHLVHFQMSPLNCTESDGPETLPTPSRGALQPAAAATSSRVHSPQRLAAKSMDGPVASPLRSKIRLAANFSL